MDLTQATAQKITQLGSGMAVSSGLVGWLTENHIILTSAGVAVGIAVGITGIYMQIVRNKRDKISQELRDSREAIEHELRVERLQAKK